MKREVDHDDDERLYIVTATLVANDPYETCLKSVVSKKRLRTLRLHEDYLKSFRGKPNDSRDKTVRSLMVTAATVANAMEYDTLRILTCDMLGISIDTTALDVVNLKPILQIFGLSTIPKDDDEKRTTFGIGLHILREYSRLHVWHGKPYRHALRDGEFVLQACLMERMRSGREERHTELVKSSTTVQVLSISLRRNAGVRRLPR